MRLSLKLLGFGGAVLIAAGSIQLLSLQGSRPKLDLAASGQISIRSTCEFSNTPVLSLDWSSNLIDARLNPGPYQKGSDCSLVLASPGPIEAVTFSRDDHEPISVSEHTGTYPDNFDKRAPLITPTGGGLVAPPTDVKGWNSIEFSLAPPMTRLGYGLYSFQIALETKYLSRFEGEVFDEKLTPFSVKQIKLELRGHSFARALQVYPAPTKIALVGGLMREFILDEKDNPNIWILLVLPEHEHRRLLTIGGSFLAILLGCVALLLFYFGYSQHQT